MSKYYYECAECGCAVETDRPVEEVDIGYQEVQYVDNIYTKFVPYCTRHCLATLTGISHVVLGLEGVAVDSTEVSCNYKEIECVIFCAKEYINKLQEFCETITKCYPHGIGQLIL